MASNYWEKYYSSKTLDEIPWQRTQADWFKHAVDTGIIAGKTALDLGCGTGKKSIYLAQHGFEKVVGVDASASAIDYANENVADANVKNVEFIVGDITYLSFLDEQKFDFILDWAALHCIDENLQEKYVSEIVKHTKQGSALMLRVFSNFGTDKEHFIDDVEGQKSKVILFDKEKINDLYSNYFTIIEFNRSQPRVMDNLRFDEYLMKRK